MKIHILLSAALLAGSLGAQMLDPAKLLKPPTDTWPTYNGDYSGRRFSPLARINASNVTAMSLAWVFRAGTGPGAGGSNTQIKATPLEVNGVLYFAVPDYAWAVDARTGRELWRYKWETRGGIHIGNRGFGMYGDWLYFETPDNYLVCLNAKDGTERWHVEIADVKQEYFSTPAPVIIRNHVIVGVGGDSLDVPGYLESRDPETGKVQWRWNTTPRKGEPGAETWPNKDAMEHGGGMTWMPGTYDPELNLYYLGTGNPNPVMAGQGRKGNNLWTCSIVALNPDTGKMAWYFQSSPHDTHDWDAVQTPVLIDGEVDGKPRKLLAQASRNGYYFLLDRATGKNLVSKPFIPINWSKGVDSRGEPVPDPDKEPKTDGTLVIPGANGATNWPAPAFSPKTGLMYVNSQESYSLFYLTDTDEKPEGYGGRDSGLWWKSMLTALDYKTGKIRWRHTYDGRGSGMSGVLTTAGNLVFAGDPVGNLIAFEAATGKILWHCRLTAPVANGPMTYELDGRQYLVVGSGDLLYGFTMLR
ncbi:MAG: acido-empty-quinoprotein group A [Bryobacterales bacterium]|nr:acido-empty-quinoprotein group A [Bryobacterales bacterium]